METMSDFRESGGRQTQWDQIVTVICCNTLKENLLLLAMKYCLCYQYEYAACTGLLSPCQCKEKHGDVSVSPAVSSLISSGVLSPLLFLRAALPYVLWGSLSPFSLCICNSWSPRSFLSHHVPCLVSLKPPQFLPIKNEELQPISGLNLKKLSVLSRDLSSS